MAGLRFGSQFPPGEGDQTHWRDANATWGVAMDTSFQPVNPGDKAFRPYADGGWLLNDTHEDSNLDHATMDPGMGMTMAPPPVFNDISMIKTVVLSMMFLISLIGNTATLAQMYKMRRRKSTINTLILHLAIADLIVTFFCNVTDAVWASTIQWYAGNYMCKMVKFIQVFGLYLSTYIIVIISLDRCYAILDPMRRIKASRRVRIMVATAWICSALFSLPQTYIFRVQRGPFVVEFYQCVTYGAYTSKWQEQLYTCVSVLLMFVIPLVTMVTAYMLIFCTIAKKSRDLQREAESANQEMLSRGPVRGQLFRKAKVKSLRMTALIVAAFIVCWTPYYIVFIIHTYFGLHSKEDDRKFIWIFFFGMANSMFNPMIYGAFQICKKRRRRVPEPICFGVHQRVGGGDTSSTSKSSHSPAARYTHATHVTSPGNKYLINSNKWQM